MSRRKEARRKALARARAKRWYRKNTARLQRQRNSYIPIRQLKHFSEQHLGITNFVVCRVCGAKLLRLIGGPASHLSTHGLTPAQYRRRWPGAPLICESLRRELSQRSKSQMESRYGHADEPPIKKWQIVCAIVQGKTYEEIGQQLNRATMTIWSAAKALDLCGESRRRAMVAFYDFGQPVTAEGVRALRKITDLSVREFAMQTGFEAEIRSRRKGHRIRPEIAKKVVAWRDSAVRQLLGTVAAPARGEHRYSGSRILKTFFPGLRSKRDFLLKILRRCRAILANTPAMSEADLGEWFCVQAVSEAGRAPGEKLFVRFLSWAPELIPFLHKNFARLTGRGNLWPLADEAIAQRWITTAAIVSAVGRHRTGRAIRPSEMRHLLLELRSDSVAPGRVSKRMRAESGAAPSQRAKGGRPKGAKDPDTDPRIWLAAALSVLGYSEYSMAPRLYPKATKTSAEKNTDTFLRRNREEFEKRKGALNKQQAEEIVKKRMS